MGAITANISIKHDGQIFDAKATKMRFSAHRCFAYDNGPDDIKCLQRIKEHLATLEGGVAFYGSGKFSKYFLKHVPEIKDQIKCIVVDDLRSEVKLWEGLVTTIEELPEEVKTVFLCETLTLPRIRMKNNLPKQVTVISPDILAELDWRSLPDRAWKAEIDSIYPIDVPEIKFRQEQDLLLIDCPSRNMAFMPNGLAYVHNALKKADVQFQTLDLDIIIYHRYHIYRIFDGPDKILTPGGKEMPVDPWQAANYDLWQDPETALFFQPEIDKIVSEIIKAEPKILGLSIQACNVNFSREVVNGVKKALPDTLILVGGYSCFQSTIGRLAFPESDYMVAGEADFTVGPLVEKLARGERPKNLPGIMSRFDTKEVEFAMAPWPHDLDELAFPKYEWFDLDIYRNYNHYRLTPIIASRGCRWSRCTFCAERFSWRIRSPKNVVDEFEWFAEHGCDLFMFNESDLNGMPEALIEICDEIIRRKLKIRLTGQLRIHKKSDSAFFEKLRSAGFVSLRFGVDAWAKNTLRLQVKGYTKEMIKQNLRDCWKAGIHTEVNTVIGVPGETDEDISETIDLMVQCKPYIDKVANINPLLLMVGSVYWDYPEKHNIHFTGDTNEIYKEYLHLIPDKFWYSEEPYIDGAVRQKRFVRIVQELEKNGFDIGDFAKQVIKDVLEGRGADGSARPGAKKAQSNEKEGAKEIDAQNESPIVDHDNDKPASLIEYNGGIYQVEGDGDIPALIGKIESVSVRKPNRAVAATRYFVGKALSLLRNPSQIKRTGGSVLRIIKADGLGSLGRVLSDRITATHAVDRLTLGSSDSLQVVRNPASEVELVVEGYNGYNIIKIGGIFFGIKQGYPFDFEKAESNGYPKDILVKEKRVKDVERQIDHIVSS